MIFDEIINSIENTDMQEYANTLIKTIPDYFWHVGASSTGKYHPSYALGDGGLARHTCALVRFLNHTFAIECMGSAWTSRERDILRIAGMMHDSRKSGDDEDYKSNKYTRFEHPLLAAEVIRKSKSNKPISITDEEVEIIASTIESHMGQWNTDKRSNTVLPTPKSKYQKMLHWADYLASRKDLEVKFDGYTASTITDEITDPTIWTFPFGKYKGQTFQFVKEIDSGYLDWLYNKADMDIREPLKTMLDNYILGKEL